MASLLGLGASSQAALLVQVTGAVNQAEYEWQDPGGAPPLGLYVGTGSTGNGDGALLENEAPPGLKLSQIPFDLSANPGGKLELDGTTSFFDVTMVLTGLDANGDASVTPIVGANILSQSLNGGTVEFWSTNPAGPDNPVLILSANISSAAMVGIEGATTAALQSTTVTYTGGLIYDALVNAGGTLTGQTSQTLLLRNSGTVVRTGDPGPLAAFSADASALFNTPTIPEPASLGLLVLGGAALLHRRIRRA
jgi:hypothetical protein